MERGKERREIKCVRTYEEWGRREGKEETNRKGRKRKWREDNNIADHKWYIAHSKIGLINKVN